MVMIMKRPTWVSGPITEPAGFNVRNVLPWLEVKEGVRYEMEDDVGRQPETVVRYLLAGKHLHHCRCTRDTTHLNLTQNHF